MRLDLGADGKIIGTRRVSPNGQVSGLSDYAGKEVLVILPGGPDGELPPPWSNVDAITRLVSDQIREAYDRYRVLQDAYPTPWEATRSFLEGLYGTPTSDLRAEVDRWIRSQVKVAAAEAPSEHRGPSNDRPSAKKGDATRPTRSRKSSARRRRA